MQKSCPAGRTWAVRQIAVSIFLSDLYRVFFVPNNNRVVNIASPSVRGLPPTDAFWRTSKHLGFQLPFPSALPASGGQSRGERVDSRVTPLDRQNKVGGGQAPDQPEKPDRRTEQNSHQRIFHKLLFVAQPRQGLLRAVLFSVGCVDLLVG